MQVIYPLYLYRLEDTEGTFLPRAVGYLGKWEIPEQQAFP